MIQRAEANCRKCGSPLGAKGICFACGWQAENTQEKSAGVGRCAWACDGEQCHYPGTISHNTQGLGPWYCRFHAAPDISASYGAQVIRESRNYRPLTDAERDALHHARLQDKTYRPKFRGCEELRCLSRGTLQPNGRYLCAAHQRGEIEFAKRGPKNSIAERLSVREPGQDDDEIAA